MLKPRKSGTKLLSVLCAFGMIFAMLPAMVSAESDVEIKVTDVVGDIVTISGSAPADAMVVIKILNPGVSAEEANSADFSKIQFFDVVFSKDGVFSRDIKMQTGLAPNKIEGIFTVLVSIDGELTYQNDNFVFYSNETKEGYIADIKSGAVSGLLEVVAEPFTKIDKIYETYAVAEHELFEEADSESLAKVICNQESRSSISNSDDLKEFLLDALVLNAFAEKSSKLSISEGIAYSEVWAADENGAVSPLYTNDFVNSLSAAGKSKVKSELFGTDWSRAQLGDVLEKFENSMYFHLIKNNVKLGAGHIESLVTDIYEAEYKAAGFDTDLLKGITNSKEKNYKLTEVLGGNAQSLSALAAEFNEIMAAEYEEEKLPSDSGSSGGNASGGGGGGGFSGGGAPQATPAPTAAPQPTTAPASGHPFEDMAESLWAEEAIEYLYKEGIINGRSEKHFAPNETVKRAELVKMIVEALDVSETAETVEFADVSDEWFAPYIKNAAAAGIIKGDGGIFKPDNAITREDAALIIFRALGIENGGEIAFSDAENISDYAKDAVAAMAEKGYINGMGDGSFAPKNTLTRAQAAQLIYNAITKGGAAQ